MPFLTQPKKIIAMGAVTTLISTSAAFAAPALDTKPVATSKTSTYVKLADSTEKSRRARNRAHSHDNNRSRNQTRSRDHHRSNNRNARRHSNHNYRSNYRHRDRRSNRHNRYYSSRHYNAPYRYVPPRRIRNVTYRPYRSHLGISFNFGSPRYSGYRWAPAAYSFYKPSYGSYSWYQTQTHCRRVTREAWHHGHRELISVKECSNPYSGTYIVQGSERLIDCRY